MAKDSKVIIKCIWLFMSPCCMKKTNNCNAKKLTPIGVAGADGVDSKMLISDCTSSLDDDELPLSSSLSVLSEFSDSARSEPIPELALDNVDSDAADIEHRVGPGLLLLVAFVVVVGDMSFANAGSASPACSVLVTRPYPIATSISKMTGNITSYELITDVVFGRRR